MNKGEILEKTEDQEGIQEENNTSDMEVKDNAKDGNIEELLSKEKEKYLRLFAEFENYKKRTTKERIDLYKTAGQEVIMSLLPVLDDFERGMVQIKSSKEKSLTEGVALIFNKLKETLKRKGLTTIKIEQGDDFNTDFHEAITQIPAPKKKLIGKVLEVIETGYRLNDKVIRFAKVIVGK